MTALIVTIFALTYLGMAAGRVPGTGLDRTGIALVAAFALLVLVPGLAARAGQAIDVPTLLILAALMLISGELELAGFYERAALRLSHLPISPAMLLGVVVFAIGGLSALLTNDVVVFALTPMLVHGLRARGLDPRPFLVAAAAASNVGSAATTIGNPQNVLIAEVGRLGFVQHLVVAGPLSVVALAIVWLVAWLVGRAALSPTPERPHPAPPTPKSTIGIARGFVALGLVIVVLVITPRPAVGLGAIGAALLVSRVRAPRVLLGRVDWPMLLLFVGLFVVTAALSSTGLPAQLLGRMHQHGLDPAHPGTLAVLCLVGANSIGNVPLVALLLAIWRSSDPRVLSMLAVFSTLAGNLLLTGSVANLIVSERAAAVGVPIRFVEHARLGVPVTALTFGLAYAWLCYAPVL